VRGNFFVAGNKYNKFLMGEKIMKIVSKFWINFLKYLINFQIYLINFQKYLENNEKIMKIVGKLWENN
jgi:hypothetical protein